MRFTVFRKIIREESSTNSYIPLIDFNDDSYLSSSISFQIYYEDTLTPINFESEKTITEFEEFVCLCLECNPSDAVLFLESYGQLDVEDPSDELGSLFKK